MQKPAQTRLQLDRAPMSPFRRTGIPAPLAIRGSISQERPDYGLTRFSAGSDRWEQKKLDSTLASSL